MSVTYNAPITYNSAGQLYNGVVIIGRILCATGLGLRDVLATVPVELRDATAVPAEL